MSPEDLAQLVVFTLDDRRYALPVSAVDRISFSVEVTPLPRAPEIVTGVINFSGRVIPVVNIRRRFSLPERDAALGDILVIAHTLHRPVAMLVDRVTGVLQVAASRVVLQSNIVPGMDYMAGVVKLDDGIVLIHDLDRFLSLEEESQLDPAMERAQS